LSKCYQTISSTGQTYISVLFEFRSTLKNQFLAQFIELHPTGYY
jgi:hypothetical protein